MKKLLIIVGIVFLGMLSFVYLLKHPSAKKVAPANNSSSVPTLIVYYSRSGNTKALAELIQAKVGGDLFRIETKEPRPQSYRKEVSQNVLEQREQLLPELKSKVPNFDSYQRIFIGTPTWNMALPQAVVSFLKSYHFAEKIVIPFNTNGGYGSGSTFRQIKQLAVGAKVLEGFSIKGGEEINGKLLVIKGQKKRETAQKVAEWLNKIKQN